MCAVKNSKSPGYRLLEFFKLKIGLKVFLNFFPCVYILKRKSFATLTKMLIPFFGPKQSLNGNAVGQSLYVPCIQHKNQKGVAYGCRAATIILRQPPILKSHGYNTSHVMRKIFLANICFQKQNGRQIQIRLIYAYVNVHYVYVTSLIFDIIVYLNTTKHQ